MVIKLNGGSNMTIAKAEEHLLTDEEKNVFILRLAEKLKKIKKDTLL